jgi:dihydroorotate dehydrogenase (fumarate)
MMDLSTTYLGFRLPHPFMPGASPLSADFDTVRRLEDAGAAAIVLPSLFEEQIEAEETGSASFLRGHEQSHAEAVSYFPLADEYAMGPERYLEHVRRVSAAVRVPVIGSLNGTSPEGWLDYARLIQDAGADALELNLHQLPFALDLPGEEIERRYLDLVHDVARRLSIPLAVKIGPYFTNVAAFAHRLAVAGADGLVLFNRFYQPDVDLESGELAHSPRLSAPAEPGLAPLSLHWTATLYGRLPADLSASGGIHRVEDALKAILTGASTVQLASALMANGVEWLGWVRGELVEWLETHGHRSPDEVRGQASHARLVAPGAVSRANYLRFAGTTRPPGLPWRLVRGD